MNIALINEFYPPHAPGGAEWSMQAMAQALGRSGHQVTIITPNYGAPEREAHGNVEIYRYPFMSKSAQAKRMPGFIWYANPFYYLYSAWQIYRIARMRDCNILHAQNKYSIPGTWLAAKMLHIPVCTSIRDTSNICRIAVCLHHFDEVPQDCGFIKLMKECSEEYYANYYPSKSPLLHMKDKIFQAYHWLDVHLRRFFLNRCDFVIGVSQGILNVHKRSRILSSRQILSSGFVYNFTDQNDAASQQRLHALKSKYGFKHEKIVLYAGGFSRGKGTADFVEACKRLKLRHDQFEAVLAGGTHLPGDSTAARALGQISQSELRDLYDLADVIVVPSVCQESLSRVLLEAMAKGKPLVGTRVGGTPEAIEDGVNGFVVERKDPVALAAAIEKIITNDLLAQKMGAQSKILANSRFAIQRNVQVMLEIYERCINNEKGAIHD